MKRSELENALIAASQVGRESEFVVIGSQAVHAYILRPPAEVLLSQECDIYPRNHPETAGLIHQKLGRRSSFARRNGYYVDVVTPEIASLPAEWEKRLTPLKFGKVTAFCLEVHDLMASKLCAGRLKDLELVAALLKRAVGTTGTLRRRISRLPLASQRKVARNHLNNVVAEIR